jgi:hypothetical protein
MAKEKKTPGLFFEGFFREKLKEKTVETKSRSLCRP